MLQVSGVGGSRVWAGGRGRSEMRFSMAASLGNGLHKLTRPPVSPSRTGAALPELRIGPPGMHLGRTIAGHRAHAACNWHASPSSPPPTPPDPPHAAGSPPANGGHDGLKVVVAHVQPHVRLACGSRPNVTRLFRVVPAVLGLLHCRLS